MYYAVGTMRSCKRYFDSKRKREKMTAAYPTTPSLYGWSPSRYAARLDAHWLLPPPRTVIERAGEVLTGFFVAAAIACRDIPRALLSCSSQRG